jgi:Tfp pilus assembly protein PilO
MIITRRPFAIYDVDLIGLAGVAALGVAAWFLAIAPWQSLAGDYRDLVTQRSVAQRALDNAQRQHDRFERDLPPLKKLVGEHAVDTPQASALPQLLSELTTLAQASGLEISTVAPAPVSAQGAYLVADVQVTGRGASQAFVRFLDELAQRNPYQTLRECSVHQSGATDEAVCDLAWTQRFFLLPPTVAVDVGGAP